MACGSSGVVKVGDTSSNEVTLLRNGQAKKCNKLLKPCTVTMSTARISCRRVGPTSALCLRRRMLRILLALIQLRAKHTDVTASVTIGHKVDVIGGFGKLNEGGRRFLYRKVEKFQSVSSTLYNNYTISILSD